MTQSELLKAYKSNKWISIKRQYAGCYYATLGNNVFRIETQENREEDGSEWVITSVSGEEHNEMDCYITHRFSLQDAQIWLVNAYVD